MSEEVHVMRSFQAIAITLVVLLVAGCNSNDSASADTDRAQGGAGSSSQGELPRGSEPVKLDPADFTTRIDNPYWPMAPGAEWVYREAGPEGTEQRVEVTVTNRTEQIANGIEARVVHDVVSEDGQPVEVTDD
jgi:hypothetical protein